MLVYWSLFFWTLIIFTWHSLSPRYVTINGILEQRPNLSHLIIGFAPIIFFAGVKGRGIIDSGAYIISFQRAQSSLQEMIIDWESKAPGFNIIEVAFKDLVSTNYVSWIFFLALISCIGIMIPLYKYSPLFGLSLYLFVASAQFVWLLNGVRQFLVVAILFGFMDLIIERKHLKYLILVLILSTIHITALIMIPVYLLIIISDRFKLLSWQIFFPISVFMVFVLVTEQIEPIMAYLLEDTEYHDIYSRALTYEGVNIFRMLAAAVPVLLMLIDWNRISKLITPEIKICIIMSVVNLGVLLVASTVGGNLFGRISIFFAVYNLIALPWVITKCFNKKSSQVVTTLAIVFYAYWFYYQMVLGWNLPYTSEYLGIFLFN